MCIRSIILRAFVLSVVVAAVAAAPACTTRRTAAPAARRVSETPTPAAPAALPTPDASARGAGAGAFNQYKFTYKRAGSEVEVSFAPELLPWNDSLVVAVAREVLVAAYDDRSENFPRRAVWSHEGAEVNAIKLEGEKFEYVFLPLRDERADAVGDRRVRRILFWQLAKGTVK
ncbi:MAG TPA: hypothetical protein VGV59_19120 [Pyrinomonadaceae bacterium]|nr:hypothetical protein [Pyrinomonadaceae bacterium]